MSVFRGRISWHFSLSKNYISPAAPDLELILFPLWYWPIMNAHKATTRQNVSNGFYWQSKIWPPICSPFGTKSYLSVSLSQCLPHYLSVSPCLCVSILCFLSVSLPYFVTKLESVWTLTFTSFRVCIVISMHNDLTLSACCGHKSEMGIDESAEVLTQKNGKCPSPCHMWESNLDP